MNQQFPSYPNRSQLAALPQTQPAPPPYYPQQSVQTQPQQSSEPTLQDSLTQPAEQSPTQQPAPLVMQPAPQPAPAAMNANYSSVFDGTPLVMATPVLHYHNRTILSQVPCILEWTTTNRIRAIDCNPQTNQIVGVALDVDPQQITKAAAEASFIIMWVNGQRIQFDFAEVSTQLLIGLGTAVSPGTGGVLYDHTIERALDNDYDWWWAAIQIYASFAKIIDGLERDSTIIDKSINMALIMGFGIPVLVIVIAFIAAAIT